MKAKTLLLFLWLMLPQTLLAQVNAVVVNMTDGTKTVFMLTDKPVITYSGNNLVLKASTKEASVPITSIINVTLEDHNTPTKIQPVLTDRVLFQQLPAGSEVRVYTVDGKFVCTQTADNDGSVSLDLSRLPSGVLIIQTPSGTIKVNN